MISQRARERDTPQMRQRTLGRLTPNPKAKLRDQVHEVMRFFHYSVRTEETYWQWIVRFLKFYRRKTGEHPTSNIQHPTSSGEQAGWRHPREMGASEVKEFLTHLAVELNVSASTQNQALNALVFLYEEVLHQPLGEIGDFMRVRRPARMPEVLSRAQVTRVLEAVEVAYRLPLSLLYGTGMRLFELLRLRVKDLDLERRQITVRDGKGFKDRVTMVPEKLVAALGEHLVAVRQQHESDLAAGYAGVWLPDALARKYSHGAGAFGARERGNDANLHARHAEAGDRGAQSAGSLKCR